MDHDFQPKTEEDGEQGLVCVRCGVRHSVDMLLGESLPCSPETRRLSPSQIATFRLCQRKWGFRYIEKLPDPPKAGQAFGKEGHSRVELWLRDGVAPGTDDLGVLIQKAIKPGFLPTPSKSLLIEKRGGGFILDTAIGVHFVGFIDCVVPPGVEIAEPIVVDHKFRKSLRYAESPGELVVDPQASIYSRVVALRFKLDRVVNRWIYYAASGDDRPRKPIGVSKVEILRTARELELGWREVLKDAVRMKRAHDEGARAMDLEVGPGGCEAFGGCPYRERCQPSLGDRLVARMVQADVENGEASKILLTLGDAIATSSDPSPITETRKEEGTMSSLADVLKARFPHVEPAPAAVAAAPATQAAAPATQAAAPATQAAAPAEKSTMFGELFGHLAPAPAVATVAAAQPAPATVATKPGAGVLAGLATGVNPPESAIAKTLPPPEDKPKAKAEPVTKAEPVAEPAAEAKTEPAEKKARAKKPKAFVLLLGAAPTKGDESVLGAVVQFSDLIAPLLRGIAEREKVPHWALVPFAQGRALLAADLDKALAEKPFEGVLVVDESSEEARAVREVLIFRADVVIRGVR
jgi:hypothetical protein